MNTAASSKVQRWALYLQQFDITVRAIGGADNGMADWLSRIGPVPDPIADAEINAISTPVHLILPLTEEEEAARTYARSPYLPTMDQWIEASKIIPKADQAYVQQSGDGLWYSIRGRRLYIPKVLQEPILYYFHGGKYGGHFGVNKTLRRITKWFYWPRQGADMAEYIAACLPYKRVHPPGKRYLRQVLERSEPFQLVSLDHVGPREWSGEKVWYLVIIDHFSRFIVVKRVRNVGGVETVRLFREFWVQVFGAPEAVLVDKGPAFKSKTFQSFVYNYLAADLVYCGTGYPQGNAVNEAVHKGIESSIVARRQYDMASNFDEMIGDVVMAYNSTHSCNST